MADLPTGCEHLRDSRQIQGGITVEETMRHFKPKYQLRGWDRKQPIKVLRRTEKTNSIEVMEPIEVDGLVIETDEDITRWVELQRSKPNPFFKYPGDLDYMFNDTMKKPDKSAMLEARRNGAIECNGEVFEFVGLEGFVVKLVRAALNWVKNNW